MATQLLWARLRTAASPRDSSPSGSWLVRDGMDRERMIDMDRRLQPVRRRAFALLAIVLLACGPWLGWWTLIPLGVAAALFRLADTQVGVRKRPEYAMFAAWLGSEVIIAISVALSGGPRNATMSWLAIPIVTLASRFSDRGIAAGIAAVFGLLAGVAFAVDAHAVLADPTLLLAPAALVGAVTILSMALMRSDVEHRDRAVIDPLTGMLNRTALAVRANELEQQAALTGEPVGIVLSDIDDFKAINDSLGHAAGDSALVDVAYIFRKNLRAFDLAYRIGGDEFLVLLPGADLLEATAVAENLRSAVERTRTAGHINVTVSCGVSASTPASPFAYDTVFAGADRALYEAKRSGRNLVCSDDSADDDPPPLRAEDDPESRESGFARVRAAERTGAR